MGSMDPKLAKELDLRYFRDQGFQRKACTSCHETFWTLDPKVTLCGDPPCVEYDFIGHPLTAKPYTLSEMREEFQRFFETKKHTRVKRYPVVARWREDIYLTIASIADFQPFVTSGEVPPPANPLVISQPCIRLNDLANVGKTGRHFTLFEMMAHHAFNSPGHFKYFADECVAYADEFLTKVLQIDRSRITYKEHVWSGGGNAGPAVEVMAGGLEVATLVFMNMVEAKDGEFEVKGERYGKMPMQIVDTGWGLERLTWASQGTPNAYQCVFPKVATFIMDKAGITERLKDPKVHRIMQEHARVSGVMSLDLASKLLELRSEVAKRLKRHGVETTPEALHKLLAPIEDAYAIADHTRCLAFMLGDGIVPSNAKAGYLARLMVRRTLRLMEGLGLTMPIRELVALQVEELRKDFPELQENLPRVKEILDLETERYGESLEKGLRLVQRSVKKGEVVSLDKLVDFYDSHGLPPDVVKRVAEPLGARVEIPDTFDAVVAQKHAKAAVVEEKAAIAVPRDLPPTTLNYYEKPRERAFDGSVVWSDGKHVAFDATLFYPEGGGQPCDKGTLTAHGQTANVVDVQKVGPVVVHVLDQPLALKPGERAHGEVDWARRTAHARHHTAVHIVNGATRHVLGPHAWQMGAQKGEASARFDIAHYKKITDEELAEIERLSNQVVMNALAMERGWMPRDQAEKEFGVVLYQGGVPPGRDLRIVKIPELVTDGHSHGHAHGPEERAKAHAYFDAAEAAASASRTTSRWFDVEACGGTHCENTAQVGPIKILGAFRIQDGVERIELAAGPAAVKENARREKLLKDAAATLAVPMDQVPKTVERFFDEWKQRGKEIDELKERLAKAQAQELLGKAERVGGVAVIVHRSKDAMPDLLKAAEAIRSHPKTIVLLGSDNGGGKIVLARSADLAVDCGPIAKEACALVGGSGGGKPDLAQGGGPHAAKLDEALETARKRILVALTRR